MIHPQRIEPQPGQESVWDYPRPPRLEQSSKEIQIVFNEVTIARSSSTYRVLETSHPPVYYIPPEDIKMEYLEPIALGRSFCEWKGLAGYYNLSVEEKLVLNAAWYYPQPTAEFLPIANYLAFYSSKMDACYVDGELVKSQAGDFYGGWITQDIVGPFKGEAGSWGW
ncbi:MAG: DUF427 domain-containing protein [Cyanobacteria bacterium J06600_6]